MSESEVNSMIASNDPAIRQKGYDARASYHFGEGWLTDAVEHAIIECRGCNETISLDDCCSFCGYCKDPCCVTVGCVGSQLEQKESA